MTVNLVTLMAIWALTALGVFAVLVGARITRLKARPRARDFQWPAMIALSLIAGAVPAFLYDSFTSRPVDLPASAERLLPPAER